MNLAGYNAAFMPSAGEPFGALHCAIIVCEYAPFKHDAGAWEEDTGEDRGICPEDLPPTWGKSTDEARAAARNEIERRLYGRKPDGGLSSLAIFHLRLDA